ncbi:hypothetical protein CEUSTIGMA_g11115.t1 [Chlamydomonas eustigma]|uniref:Uncharacterized protein n=1 Tax=Chlamydomonas eustigma TaxID=1157962 RepID=A0A250XLN3_9CHLO|nr:hypothetical protein CEUSTIGMA_g11115.t1 [Chlamydomonas eustigma]|eukprot:GAX83690.1 hypothetical protein CEUSTIGMA_g11115.t1 [Chlamydomonas eustigma]
MHAYSRNIMAQQINVSNRQAMHRSHVKLPSTEDRRQRNEAIAAQVAESRKKSVEQLSIEDRRQRNEAIAAQVGESRKKRRNVVTTLMTKISRLELEGVEGKPHSLVRYDCGGILEGLSQLRMLEERLSRCSTALVVTLR